jgi:hypothetical protein
MNAAEITAICTGIPAVLGAITALVIAVRSSSTASEAKGKATAAVAFARAHEHGDAGGASSPGARESAVQGPADS